VRPIDVLRKIGRDSWGGSDASRKTAFTLLLLLLAVGPFPYGALAGGPRSAIGGGAALPIGNTVLCSIALLIAALTFLPGPSLTSPRPLAIPLGAMAALALLGVVQLLPLPERILEAVAPVNATIYHETGESLRLFSRKAPTPRISIAPTETIDTLILILAYSALFLSALSLLDSRPRRRLAVGALLASALAEVVVAAALRSGERVHGPFTNPDHFAGYLEIALALAFGALWAEVLTSRDRAAEALERAERFERRFPAMAARLLLWSLIAAGIALTESRGGMLAAGVTTLFLFGAAILHRRSRAHGRAATATGLALLLAILFVGAAVGAQRFYRFLETDPRDLTGNTRVALWKTSLAAWREFPFVGSGLGTFREAFRRVQPRELRAFVEQAHNDFLQLAVTGGAVGAALGVLLFVSLFTLLLRAWARQRHREESALALAGLGALLSLTLHGLVEFNLSIPIIPATLACVLGASWAAARRE
jgi:O-antigen ligase